MVQSTKLIKIFLLILTVALLTPPALFAVASLYTLGPLPLDELPAMILLGFGLLSFAGFLRISLED